MCEVVQEIGDTCFFVSLRQPLPPPPRRTRPHNIPLAHSVAVVPDPPPWLSSAASSSSSSPRTPCPCCRLCIYHHQLHHQQPSKQPKQPSKHKQPQATSRLVSAPTHQPINSNPPAPNRRERACSSPPPPLGPPWLHRRDSNSTRRSGASTRLE